MNKVGVVISGPLFGTTVASVVNRAVEGTVKEVMEKGESRLDEVLRPRPAGVYLSVEQAGRGKASAGHYRRSVHGERRGMWATISDSGVVYGPWLEGVSSRNQTTRFKGYHSFRTAAQWLQKQVLGILGKYITSLTRQLGGR